MAYESSAGGCDAGAVDRGDGIGGFRRAEVR
jgi:hypothetical protein